MKALILPGNGGSLITSIWYPYVKEELEKLNIEVIAENMPDPVVARMSVWLPFMKEKLCNEKTILIGHSSGATAILKFLETNECALAILVGTYHTDLNNDLERQAEYFDTPWRWEDIKKNAKKIVIFASEDDPFIPIAEPRYIREKLDAEYYELREEGHYNSKTEFPEIIDVVKNSL